MRELFTQDSATVVLSFCPLISSWATSGKAGSEGRASLGPEAAQSRTWALPPTVYLPAHLPSSTAPPSLRKGSAGHAGHARRMCG